MPFLPPNQQRQSTEGSYDGIQICLLLLLHLWSCNGRVWRHYVFGLSICLCVYIHAWVEAFPTGLLSVLVNIIIVMFDIYYLNMTNGFTLPSSALSLIYMYVVVGI